MLFRTVRRVGHRPRAIGHLHEAEDESQEWPDLHAAIREARKTYQADGTIPDWEALAPVNRCHCNCVISYLEIKNGASVTS